MQPVWTGLMRRYGDEEEARETSRSPLEKAKRRADAQTAAGGNCRKAWGALIHGSLHLSTLGMPPGVILFVRLLLESAILFACISAATIPLLRDAVHRNHLRGECRLGAAGGRAPHQCGYAGIPVSRDAPPVRGLSLLGYGCCEEYTAPVRQSSGTVRSPLAAKDFGRFVRTEGAAFCAVGGLEQSTLMYWYADLVLCLIFVLRLHHLAEYVERHTSAMVWSTSDYSVLLRRLDGVLIDEARAALLADLAALGFGAEHIDHIEFGVVLHDECAAREAHLASRTRHADEAAEHGGTASPQSHAELAKSEARLLAITLQPQTTTGHAFVVLQLEADRNRLFDIIRTAQRDDSAAAPFPRAASSKGGKGVTASMGPVAESCAFALPAVSNQRTPLMC